MTSIDSLKLESSFSESEREIKSPVTIPELPINQPPIQTDQSQPSNSSSEKMCDPRLAQEKQISSSFSDEQKQPLGDSEQQSQQELDNLKSKIQKLLDQHEQQNSSNQEESNQVKRQSAYWEQQRQKKKQDQDNKLGKTSQKSSAETDPKKKGKKLAKLPMKQTEKQKQVKIILQSKPQNTISTRLRNKQLLPTITGKTLSQGQKITQTETRQISKRNQQSQLPIQAGQQRIDNFFRKKPSRKTSEAIRKQKNEDLKSKKELLIQQKKQQISSQNLHQSHQYLRQTEQIIQEKSQLPDIPKESNVSIIKYHKIKKLRIYNKVIVESICFYNPSTNGHGNKIGDRRKHRYQAKQSIMQSNSSEQELEYLKHQKKKQGRGKRYRKVIIEESDSQENIQIKKPKPSYLKVKKDNSNLHESTDQIQRVEQNKRKKSSELVDAI